jgi:hypothetical protein
MPKPKLPPDPVKVSALTYLNADEAGAYTSIAPSTLAKYRWRGDGPVFIRVTPRKIRYRRTDLDAWLAARARVSTSDDGSALGEIA